jgi:hypothetical protein
LLSAATIKGEFADKCFAVTQIRISLNLSVHENAGKRDSLVHWQNLNG